MLSFIRVYTTGTTTSVRTVELARPPITTVASSAPMMPPASSANTASGSSAKLVVIAVMRIGRSLIRPPSISASYTLKPRCLSCSTNAMSTIAFVTTMPIRSRMPIMAGSPSDLPVMASAARAPISASGRLVTITNGFLSEPRPATITRYTSTISDGHRQEDVLEALRNLREHAAAGHLHARRQRQAIDLLLNLDPDRLRVVSRNAACDARRAHSIRAADCHRARLDLHGGDRPKRNSPKWARDHKSVELLHAVDVGGAARQRHVDRAAIDFDLGHGLADKELVDLERDLLRAETGLRGGGGGSTFTIISSRASVTSLVTFTTSSMDVQLGHELARNRCYVRVVRASDADLDSTCRWAVGDFGDVHFSALDIAAEPVSQRLWGVFGHVRPELGQDCGLVEPARTVLAERNGRAANRGDVHFGYAADLVFDLGGLCQRGQRRRAGLQRHVDRNIPHVAGAEQRHRNERHQAEASDDEQYCSPQRDRLVAQRPAQYGSVHALHPVFGLVRLGPLSNPFGQIARPSAGTRQEPAPR